MHFLNLIFISGIIEKNSNVYIYTVFHYFILNSIILFNLTIIVFLPLRPFLSITLIFVSLPFIPLLLWHLYYKYIGFLRALASVTYHPSLIFLFTSGEFLYLIFWVTNWLMIHFLICLKFTVKNLVIFFLRNNSS